MKRNGLTIRYTVAQLPAHAGIHGGAWFVGAPYYRTETNTQHVVPRGPHTSRVWWTLGGPLLDDYEIAQGSHEARINGGAKPTQLYDVESDARAALARERDKARRALRKHEATCVACSNPGLQDTCEARAPLAYTADQFLDG